MAIGAALYAVFSWLFNGTVFFIPSVSQVTLRPAIAIPIFFGFALGPVVGFFTGAVGNMFGDALTGFRPVSSVEHWGTGWLLLLPAWFASNTVKQVLVWCLLAWFLAILAVGTFG